MNNPLPVWMTRAHLRWLIITGFFSFSSDQLVAVKIVFLFRVCGEMEEPLNAWRWYSGFIKGFWWQIILDLNHELLTKFLFVLHIEVAVGMPCPDTTSIHLFLMQRTWHELSSKRKWKRNWKSFYFLPFIMCASCPLSNVRDVHVLIFYQVAPLFWVAI